MVEHVGFSWPWLLTLVDHGWLCLTIVVYGHSMVNCGWPLLTMLHHVWGWLTMFTLLTMLRVGEHGWLRLTGFCVRNDIGLRPVIGTFLMCSCTIQLVILSYLNFFRLGTLIGLYGVRIPRPSLLNWVWLLVSPIDISRISVSVNK